MNKRTIITVLFVLALIIVSGCDDSADDVIEKRSYIDFSIGQVTDVNGIDDKTYNSKIYEGASLFSDDTGAVVYYTESDIEKEYQLNIVDFIAKDVDLVVVPGNTFKEAINELSEKYLDEKFLIIDAVAENRGNVVSAVFIDEEGAFLMGVIAASTAKEAMQNTVGFIGGSDTDSIWKYEAGFEAGVKAVDDEMIVLSDYIGDSSVKSRTVAASMYDEGAYIIYHAADEGSVGIIEEAKKRQNDGEVVWVIGNNYDQYNEGIYNGVKSVVLTSMVKQYGVPLYSVADQILNDVFPGGQVIEFSCHNGGITIPENNPNLSEDVIKKYKSFVDVVTNKKVTIPKIPIRLQ